MNLGEITVRAWAQLQDGRSPFTQAHRKDKIHEKGQQGYFNERKHMKYLIYTTTENNVTILYQVLTVINQPEEPVSASALTTVHNLSLGI